MEFTPCKTELTLDVVCLKNVVYNRLN